MIFRIEEVSQVDYFVMVSFQREVGRRLQLVFELVEGITWDFIVEKDVFELLEVYFMRFQEFSFDKQK